MQVLGLCTAVMFAGPALAATLVVPGDYGNVLDAAMGVYVLVIVLITISTRIAARA